MLATTGGGLICVKRQSFGKRAGGKLPELSGRCIKPGMARSWGISNGGA